MHRLGIGTTHAMKSVLTEIFLASWRFRGYTVQEKIDLWRGRAFSRSFGLWDQLIRIATSLAKDYFEGLHAPVKGFSLFDNSAHSPVLEEPQQAHRMVEQDVMAGKTTLADRR